MDPLSVLLLMAAAKLPFRRCVVQARYGIGDCFLAATPDEAEAFVQEGSGPAALDKASQSPMGHCLDTASVLHGGLPVAQLTSLQPLTQLGCFACCSF